MIEIPPPSSFEGRTLRYGAMTCGQYVWMRARWSFAVCVFTVSIGIWEFTLLPYDAWAWVWGVILFVSTATNLWVAFGWRRSWRFWRISLEHWLIREELSDFMTE